jgi:CxxC motif-containing protein
LKETFTSLVRIKGDNKHRVVSIKSNKEVDKKLFVEFSKVLGRIYVGTPINIGDIICSNILNTGVDIISTRKIEKE